MGYLDDSHTLSLKMSDDLFVEELNEVGLLTVLFVWLNLFTRVT